jgi:predicted nucleic acid-binding protein
LLVVDASVVVKACIAEKGFAALPAAPLIAPPLLWSEVSSALHEMRWRGTIDRELAAIAIERFESAPIERRRPGALLREAWRLADELGWAKTYDAEYIALAVLLDTRLLTIDARMRRSAGRLVTIIGPTGE